VIPGSQASLQTFSVPVTVTNLPAGYELESIDPPAVEAVFSGLRRDFLWIDRGGLKVEIDAFLVQLGRRTFTLTPKDVVHPETVDVRRVEPDTVKVSLRRIEPPAPQR